MFCFTNVAYIFWSDERQVFCVARFLTPSEPFGLPRPLFFGSSAVDSKGTTLILEYTPLEETVVTPLGIGARRFWGAAAGGGGSFFVILRRRGGGGLSSSSSSGFLNETCLGFRSTAIACGVRMDIALVSFFALAKGFGRITRGARAVLTTLLERLRVVSTLSSRVPSVGA